MYMITNLLISKAFEKIKENIYIRAAVKRAMQKQCSIAIIVEYFPFQNFISNVHIDI